MRFAGLVRMVFLCRNFLVNLAYGKLEISQ